MKLVTSLEIFWFYRNVVSGVGHVHRRGDATVINAKLTSFILGECRHTVPVCDVTESRCDITQSRCVTSPFTVCDVIQSRCDITQSRCVSSHSHAVRDITQSGLHLHHQSRTILPPSIIISSTDPTRHAVTLYVRHVTRHVTHVTWLMWRVERRRGLLRGVGPMRTSRARVHTNTSTVGTRR